MEICALSHHYTSATVSWCAYEEAAGENVAHLIQRHFVIRFTAAPLRHCRRVLPPSKRLEYQLQPAAGKQQWSLGNWSVCTQWPACTNVLAGRRITYVKFLPTKKWESCVRLLLPNELLKYNQIQQTLQFFKVPYEALLNTARYWKIGDFGSYLSSATVLLWHLGQIWLFEYVHISHSGWITCETLY